MYMYLHIYIYIVYLCHNNFDLISIFIRTINFIKREREAILRLFLLGFFIDIPRISHERALKLDLSRRM